MATAVRWEAGAPEHRGSAAHEGPRNTWRDRTGVFKLRSIPNEDVYFFCPPIDNSRLVKADDPAERRRAAGMTAVSVTVVVAVLLLLSPRLLNLFAGVQIHRLEEDRRKLIVEHDVLEFEESRLMDPKRMKAIAREHNLVEPSPQQVHYLNPAITPRSKEVLEATKRK
ncbi:MAG: hypothetical protein LC114_17500 [Bryobacterales bacterium]|nr:hypothetical protein [Bryobacterales bacterium]